MLIEKENFKIQFYRNCDTVIGCNDLYAVISSAVIMNRKGMFSNYKLYNIVDFKEDHESILDLKDYIDNIIGNNIIIVDFNGRSNEKLISSKGDPKNVSINDIIEYYSSILNPIGFKCINDILGFWYSTFFIYTENEAGQKFISELKNVLSKYKENKNDTD